MNPAIIHGLSINQLEWQPDFKASQDDSGLWIGSMSFMCRKSDVGKKIPTKGTKCPAEGFGFMTSESSSVEDIKGDLYKVTVTFAGSNGTSETGDDEEEIGTEEMTLTTSNVSLLYHPRYRDLSEGIKEDLRAIRDGQLQLIVPTEGLSQPISSLRFKYANIKKTSQIVILEDERAVECALKLLGGIHEYLRADQIYRYTFSSKFPVSSSKLNVVGKITSNPYYKGSVGNGRNWLFTGCNSVQRGNAYTITYEWRLSDFGGWDSKIYSAQV